MPRWWERPWGGAALILGAALLAYATSFGGVFVFDDVISLVENPTIRRLGAACTPPSGGATVSGRPVLNFSFALNHAVSGLAPWSYHALNLLIHALAGLTLFGLVRRAFESPFVAARWRTEARPLALAVALLWTVHPLQTQAVTYVVQRAESLMGLFYLLTLYAFLRGATAERRAGWWFGLAVMACLLGTGTKEVIVTAPILALFLDRTFVAGSFATAGRQRWPVHVALLATWLPLAGLILGNDGGTRGGTTTLGGDMAWWSYGLTQFEAVTRYLGLAVWPYPLTFEYGTFWVKSAGQVLLFVPGVVALVAGTIWALRRCPVAGFIGAWFLGILAPTSLMPGTLQMVVEHRMYLPLAAVLTVMVLGLRAVAGRGTWPVLGGLVLAGVALTAQRNLDYHSVLGLWADTVAKRPANANARNNLGNALADAGRLDEAVAEYEELLRLSPQMPDARYNLGLALATLGRAAEAVPQLEESLRLRPDHAPAEVTLGNALTDLGRFAEAIPHFEAALRLDPSLGKIRHNLGMALARAGRFSEAVTLYTTILQDGPGDAETHYNLGNVLRDAGRPADAVPCFQAAVRLNPAHASAHYNLGNALLVLGRLPEAIEAYTNALRVRPNDPDAHNNLGSALGQLGRTDEAHRHFSEALRLRPGWSTPRDNLELLGR